MCPCCGNLEPRFTFYFPRMEDENGYICDEAYGYECSNCHTKWAEPEPFLPFQYVFNF